MYYVFKTDIHRPKQLKQVRAILSNHPAINDWNVDTNDVDNVLRVRQSLQLKEKDLIQYVRAHGFYCEALPD